MSQFNSLPQETEITVWGPTQSGKDWLYKGFAKELEEFTLRSQDFIFDLREKRRIDLNFTPVLAEPPNEINPTSIGEDYIHSFTRKIKENQGLDSNKLSTYTHYINFHNNRGADLVAALLDPARFETTFLSIIKSQYLLIVLDPNFEKTEDLTPIESSDIDQSSNVDEYPEVALRPGMSKDNYYKILTMLLEALANYNSPKKYLAVCITKTDTLKISSSDPWYLLERTFGQKIFRLFDNYRRVFNMEAFATSAAGYATIKGKSTPNFTHSINDHGKLLDSAHWRPINCAAPFFWIFQNRELEQIKLKSNFLNKESNLRNYKRYPLPIRNI
jgi:hypothetical protein